MNSEAGDAPAMELVPRDEPPRHPVRRLVFGGRAATRHPTAKLFAGALTIFLIVFGTGVSPIPGSAAETFSTRVTYILTAIAYAIFMAALLWPGRPTQNHSRYAS